MKLIVGLGNPGEKYKNTRHSVGFMVVNRIGQDYCLPTTDYSKWEEKSNLLSVVCGLKTVDVLLAQPHTFMNNSGEAVKKLVDWFKVKYDDLYVIHDELDIKLGEYKIQKGKGPKVHNGLLSIEEKLGTADFWRIRVGVDNRKPENRISGEQYVLEDFENEEKEIIDQVIAKIIYGFKFEARSTKS